MKVSHTHRADSPTEHDDIIVLNGAAHDAPEGHTPERISGAIARAVRKSVTRRDRREPLPNAAFQLRADRARAIVQRDSAQREAENLRRQLQRARSDLAAARRGSWSAQTSGLEPGN